MRIALRNGIVAGMAVMVAFFPLAAASGEVRRRFGERYVSSREIAEFIARSTTVSRVAPNEIAVKRIMTARRAAPRASRGLPPPEAVEKGFEFFGMGADFTRADLDLLSAVTNEDNPSFPPIADQGDLGSCASWSAAYYMLTNNTAVVRGWDAKGDPVSRFSPRWCYNATNMGLDNGGWIHKNIDYFRAFGCALKVDFDYANPVKPTAEPGEYQDLSTDSGLWRKALDFRPGDETFLVDKLDTEDGLGKLKAVLANGYVACFGTSYMDGWEVRGISGGPHAGKQCAVGMHQESDYSGHAMTIVGYDDGVWVDVNKNGKADSGEKGALRVANSWGPGYGDNGYVWVLYDALREESSIPGYSLQNRERLVRGALAYYAIGRQEYEPLLLAEVRLSCRKRSNVSVMGAVGDYPDFDGKTGLRWLPNFSSEDSGPVALSGRKNEAVSFYLDLTDLVTDSGTQKWNIVVKDAAAGNPTYVESIRLAQWSNGEWLFSECHPHVPGRLDDEEKRFWFRYAFGGDFPSYRTESASGAARAGSR
ncbi:MAG: C1 family peptidase [Planctomycetota bacterium]|jgi:hypothetical protein|nr:C1 family peptidase [Planctomycetota bacterium]